MLQKLLELFLYQLSIWGLVVSSAMIAIFFVVLSRTNRRAEMTSWTYGWLANLAAMLITLAFWYAQPPAQWHGVTFAVYLFAKNIYVWMLVRGALEFRSLWPRMLDARRMWPALVVFSIASILLVNTRDRLGFVTMAVVGTGFIAAAIALARARADAARWIVIAFAGRGILAAAEASAYGVNLVQTSFGQQVTVAFIVPANWLLAAHYPLDTAAEWLVAMGCFIGVSIRAQRALESANTLMLSAQADLRKLADRDPLTSLVNRRTLPEVLRGVQPRGAMVVFFDLNDFKSVNDRYGHQAGDECLIRFAGALSSCFRPTDAVIRYAGDEFVVVASGLDESSLAERVDAVRQRLRPAKAGELPIRFSYGVSNLPPGGNPDEALRAADEAMYRAKPATKTSLQGTEAPA